MTPPNLVLVFWEGTWRLALFTDDAMQAAIMEADSDLDIADRIKDWFGGKDGKTV